MVGRGLIATGWYPGLFGTPAGNVRAASGYTFGPGEDPAQAFNRRFGVARLFERNRNLLEVLNNPSAALSTVNNELVRKGTNLSVKYNERLKEFRKLGFGEEEAIARADIMTGRELENEVSLMQLQYPYAMGGAAAGGWDPVQAILMGTSGGGYNPTLGQKFQRGMQAINSGGIMGNDKLKAKFKRKFKRRYKRRARNARKKA